MVSRQTLIAYLNDLLNVTEFEDYCVNGLQVEGKEEINRVVCGVSASERLFQEALDREADAILVHHGLFWQNAPWTAVTGFRRRRLALLLNHDINLLAYHLPLDAHPVHGNNARIASILGLDVKAQVDVGCIAESPQPQTWTDFLASVTGRLDRPVFEFQFGPRKVRRVGILSGGGADYYEAAIEAGCDTYLTGEIREHIVREAEESHLNYVVLGHYNSEKWGPLSLCEHLKDALGLETEFIDVPNPY